MIYFDSAATTLGKPESVVRAVTESFGELGNAGRGACGASLAASRTIYSGRCLLAELFHAEDPSRIAFTSNATESLNTAIRGLLNPGDHVITTVLEHNSVLRPLYSMEDQGVHLSFIGLKGEREKGVPDLDAIPGLIRPETKAVVCTHASNLTGNLVDLTRVGRMAHERGLLFIVDAAQTAGIFPIDVQAMQIDVLCFSGHKGLLGPQGTGGLYVRPGLSVRPLKTGGSGVQSFLRHHPEEMPTALEAGTLNGHGIAGLAAGVRFILENGMDALRRKELQLMRRFYDGIRGVPGVRIYGDFASDERCPTVAMNIGNYDSGEVADELASRFGICTRPGAHCAPRMHEALGTVKQGAVRFSFSFTNTGDEADEAVRAVRTLAEEG